MSQTMPPGPAPSAPPPSAPALPRTRPPLRRSRTDRKLAGVAGGLARHFDVDPLLVRIAFVVLTLAAAGTGLILYLVCLAMIPDEGDDTSEVTHFVDRHGRTVAAVVGIVIVCALFTASGPFEWGPQNDLWGLLVVVAVLAIVWVVRNDRRRHPNQFDPIAQPSPYSPTTPTTPFATTGATPPNAEATATPGAAGPTTPYAGPPPTPLPSPFAPPQPAWTPKERSALGPLTVGIALVTTGVLVGLDRGDVVTVPTVVILASALAVVGLGLMVGAVFGKSRGLVALGIVLSVLTAIAGVVHVPTSRSVGDINWRPASVTEVEPLYSWGAGSVFLDLTKVSSPTPVPTGVELGAGNLTVIVPRNATVELDAHVGAGVIRTTGPQGSVEEASGIHRTVTTVMVPDRKSSGTTFRLDVQVGLGEVEIDRA